MSSLIEELHRREEAAREDADELRREIAELNEHIARAEDRLAKLEFARETVAKNLGGTSPESAESDQVRWETPASDPESASSRFGRNSPIGVRTVPPWSVSLDVSVLPRAYQNLFPAGVRVVRDVRRASDRVRHVLGCRPLP
ncbi:hypothetical protein [Streptomyces sp. NPDC020747]|uniref:hypothetical protein n=1 Tax=Streptomyces sp. NPDC020747 TaxID=3365086 RepID=UPI0037AA56D9